MVVSLIPQQQRIIIILGNILLRSKIQRQADIIEMNGIVRTLTADQLIRVINSINVPQQLKFLIPAGAFASAREALIIRIGMLEERATK